jgi:hypothetical protein
MQKKSLPFSWIWSKKYDHAGDRTQNLLIRSQTPCHWATRPDYLLCLSRQILDKCRCRAYSVVKFANVGDLDNHMKEHLSICCITNDYFLLDDGTHDGSGLIERLNLAGSPQWTGEHRKS